MNKIKLPIFLSFFILFSTQLIAEQPKIKIGYVTALTGDNAFFGEQEVIAAKLAIEDLKAEGIEAEVIFEDSQTNPQIGLSSVMKLLNSDHVDAFFVSFSPVVNATIGTLEGADKLLVYSAAARSPLSKHKHSFKTYLDYVDGCKLLADKFKESKIKFTYLKPEIESGTLCENGLKLVSSDFMIHDFPKDSIPKTEILLSKKNKTEAIVTAGYPQAIINIIHAAKMINYKPLIADSDYVFNNQVLSLYKKELEGSIAYGMNAKRPKSYDDRHINLLKDKTIGVIPYAGVDYIHIKQIARSIKNCPKNNTDCQADHLAKSPAEVDFGFLGWENRIAKINLQLKTVKDGRLVEDK